MKWISVNDALPEQSDEVLAYNGWVAPCYMSTKYIAGKPAGHCFRFMSGDEGYEMLDVTHWMPFPEPPND